MHMQIIPYKKIVLVCGNIREDGRASCGPQGGVDLKDKIKAACKLKELPVRVVQTSCLGQCDFGPNVMIQPEGIWFSDVGFGDVDDIVKMIEKDLV